MNVVAGNARANIDRAIVRTPKPICTAQLSLAISLNTCCYISYILHYPNVKVLKNLIWNNLLPIDICL